MTLQTQNTGFTPISSLKQKPVYKEITIESGHPDNAIHNLIEKLEDMGFTIRKSGSRVSQDNVAEGVKDYVENIEANRLERVYRENANEYRTYFWASLFITLVSTSLFFITRKNYFLIFVLIFGTCTYFLFLFSLPQIKKDTIYVKAEGKVYTGTKAREQRETGKHKAGVTRTAISVYVYSELTFFIAGDSQIDVQRIRDDINQLSKQIQRL